MKMRECENMKKEYTNKKLTAKEKQILSDLDEAVKQVTLHKKGKIKLKTLEEVLKEL
jgi:hypothetical protein